MRMPYQIKAFPRNYMYCFHVNPIGALVVAELHLVSREVGKWSLFQIAMPAENGVFYYCRKRKMDIGRQVTASTIVS